MIDGSPGGKGHSRIILNGNFVAELFGAMPSTFIKGLNTNLTPYFSQYQNRGFLCCRLRLRDKDLLDFQRDNRLKYTILYPKMPL